MLSGAVAAPIWVNAKPPTNRVDNTAVWASARAYHAVTGEMNSVSGTNKVVYTSDIYYYDMSKAHTNAENKRVVKCTPNLYFPVTNSITVTPDMKVWVNFTTTSLIISNKTEVIVIKGEFEDK
jgi:hypothetical protein